MYVTECVLLWRLQGDLNISDTHSGSGSDTDQGFSDHVLAGAEVARRSKRLQRGRSASRYTTPWAGYGSKQANLAVLAAAAATAAVPASPGQQRPGTAAAAAGAVAAAAGAGPSQRRFGTAAAAAAAGPSQQRPSTAAAAAAAAGPSTDTSLAAELQRIRDLLRAKDSTIQNQQATI